MLAMQNILGITLVVLVAAGALGISLWFKAKRKREFLAAAVNLGFVAVGEDDDDLPLMDELPLFEHRGEFEVCARGNWNGMEACLFDYDYRQGKSSVTQTVASFIKTGYSLPLFEVRPHHFGDGIAHYFSSEVVEFEDDPEFSKRMTVA